MKRVLQAWIVDGVRVIASLRLGEAAIAVLAHAFGWRHRQLTLRALFVWQREVEVVASIVGQGLRTRIVGVENCFESVRGQAIGYGEFELVRIARASGIGRRQRQAYGGVRNLGHHKREVACEAMLGQGVNRSIAVAPFASFAVDEMASDKWKQQRIATTDLGNARPVGVIGPEQDVLSMMDPTHQPATMAGGQQQIAVVVTDPEKILTLVSLRGGGGHVDCGR